MNNITIEIQKLETAELDESRENRATVAAGEIQYIKLSLNCAV